MSVSEFFYFYFFFRIKCMCILLGEKTYSCIDKKKQTQIPIKPEMFSANEAFHNSGQTSFTKNDKFFRFTLNCTSPIANHISHFQGRSLY